MPETCAPKVPTPHEPLIGIDELARWLGFKPDTVRKWAAAGPASGRIPPMLRVAGEYKFRPEDVRAWLESKAVRG
jgi:predicted site-specific integrase-resolvase